MGRFYVSTRKRGYQSDAVTNLARQQMTSKLISGWAKARIPKLTIGDVTEDVYEDGYAPEEIARLVFASLGRRETSAEKFDRLQSAKTILSRTPVCDELWEEAADGFFRKRYEQYLEAKSQGYKGDFKEWNLEYVRKQVRYLNARESIDTGDSDRKGYTAESSSKTLEEIVGRGKGLDDVNYMEGWEFERYMADVLGRSGYSVESTQLSGDQGVDMLLDMEDRKIAVQLKRYTRPVGNKAVQEVLAGRVHYAAQEAWVITTSSFTRGAMELARSTGVRLIDGRELREWLSELNREQDA
jgi:restriction endonuclease Mrr